MARAPFPPLVADGEGLDCFPERPAALIARMAAVYGVDDDCVLPTQGAAQALALVARRAALDGRASVAGAGNADLARIAKINRLTFDAQPSAKTGLAVVASPNLDGEALAPASIAAQARALGDGLLLIDESLIEFEAAESAITLVASTPNLIVLRDLSLAYGLAGAPCAALIAAPALIARLREAEESAALATPIVRLAAAALDPARVAANAGRIEEIKSERTRLLAALPIAQPAGGPYIWLAPDDRETAAAAIRRFAVAGAWRGDRFLMALGAPADNDRALAAFAAAPARAPRRAEVVRETQETRIVARVDLDREGAGTISTGIGFFDHMLSQIATHGGFSLTLACDGDLEVDAHHTIEDCALALGAALKQALGARRGLARFGFVLPMDEAEARVSVDLGGRPYLVFDGGFAASHIGAYPTEMTEHVFRSLAQSIGAAIHLHVTGENDHHKTEACYKAFGRALRQALRVEGDVLPSTKGVI